MYSLVGHWWALDNDEVTNMCTEHVNDKINIHNESMQHYVFKCDCDGLCKVMERLKLQ